MFTISVNRELNDWAIPKLDVDHTEPIEHILVEDPKPEIEQVEPTDDGILLEIQCIEPQDIYTCDMCDACFVSRSDRNNHINEHFQSYECKTCGQTFVGERQFEHHQRNKKCIKFSRENDNITYECFVCHKGNFFSVRSLKIHYNRFHKEKNAFKDKKSPLCKICNKVFANIYILKSHQEEVHTKQNQFKCDDCGKVFNRASNMEWHRLIHKNLLPCPCKICGKAFRTVSGLNLHKRTHTGEKPYKCDICNEKSYAYNTDLKRHKRSAHGIIDKVFQCTEEHCQRIFYEPKFLRKHMAKAHS